MSKRRKSNPRLRRAWNKRPKYMPSFTNMKEYTNFQVMGAVNAKELARGEPVMMHDTLLMLKRLGDFHQGIDKWHEVKMPFLLTTDKMFFHGNMYVFFRDRDGVITRTSIYHSKEKAISLYRQGRCHFFIPYVDEEEKTKYDDPITGLKPHPRPRPVPKEE